MIIVTVLAVLLIRKKLMNIKHISFEHINMYPKQTEHRSFLFTIHNVFIEVPNVIIDEKLSMCEITINIIPKAISSPFVLS